MPRHALAIPALLACIACTFSSNTAYAEHPLDELLAIVKVREAEIEKTVQNHKIVVFAKGSKEQPMCGFSHRAIAVMHQVGQPFEVVNIFDDASIRPALVEFSQWPTTPQVFVGGEFDMTVDAAGSFVVYRRGTEDQLPRAIRGVRR